jgi:hypothetical protein
MSAPVQHPVTKSLHVRGMEDLPAQDDGKTGLGDDELLIRAMAAVQS